ncbi:hypothetical protein At1D132_36380 [Agrobacterium fabrum]|nr:hypothetical protein At1D132_36380 [Agrobacterium fabrum]
MYPQSRPLRHGGKTAARLAGPRRFYPSIERQQIPLEGYHADHPDDAESRYCGNRNALQKLRNCPVNS